MAVNMILIMMAPVGVYVERLKRMTKKRRSMVDVRSTGRRRARKELFEARIDFKCAGTIIGGITTPCDKTVITPPKDAPEWFEEIWPTEKRVLKNSLQADHESKDLEANDIRFLNWRCSSCHKLQDNETEKGEATVDVDLW